MKVPSVAQVLNKFIYNYSTFLSVFPIKSS